MTEKQLVLHDPQESITLQKVSEGLFASGLFPNAKNKYGAFAIVQYGRELGIPPMMSLKNINLISGQLACNAQLMLTLAIQKGITYEVLQEGDKGAKIRFKRGASSYESSFTEEDARAAGLLGKDNWKKYPRDMYFWRAVAKGIRRVAPDAVMGLYTAEEITEGQVIEVAPIDVKPQEAVEVADAPDVPEPPLPEPQVEYATKDQIKKIQIMMQEKGFTNRSAILDELSAFCNRLIKSSKDLTKEEASEWIEKNTTS